MEAIARLYSIQDQTGEELSWRMYLLDPAHSADPTAAVVAAVLGTQAPAASDCPLQDVAGRLIALGKVHNREKRLAEARASFEQALSAAAAARSRVDALVGLANVLGQQSEQSGRDGQRAEAFSRFAEAREVAGQAADACLALSTGGACGDSHYANEQAVELYRSLRLNKEALDLADRFLSRLTESEAPSSKLAFATLMRIRALAWNNRLNEAVEGAVQLDDRHPQDDGPGFSTIRTVALIRASSCCDRLGDPAKGLALLDRVRARYGADFDQWVAPRYEMLRKKLN